MPNRDNAPMLFATARSSPRFLRNEIAEQERPMAVRKSPRLSHQERGDQKSPRSQSHSEKDSPKRVIKGCSENVSKKSRKPSEAFGSCGNLSAGSKSSLFLEDGIEGFPNLRRSSRISVERKGLIESSAKKSPGSGGGSRTCGNLSSGFVKSPRIRNVVAGLQSPRRSLRILSQLSEKKSSKADSVNKNDKSRIVKFENRVVLKIGKKENLRNVAACPKGVAERARELEAEEDKEEFERERSIVLEVGSRNKRKLDECKESNGTVQEWTKDQELALRRAYLNSKPTPQFWKKVSRLVPGKSAQECFDKLYSDYATPPQCQRVSREKKRRLSPITHFQLSASKVLKPGESKSKKQSSNRKNSRVTYKNARHLLQEHYHRNQVHEADLFSVLEPNQSIVLSTPKRLRDNQEFHHKFNERSSSGHKKALSRFSAAGDKVLASPPVLKMVKNKILHEKYIDQLHSRDARRKTARENASKGPLTAYDRSKNCNKKLNVVVAAKNALVSDARDAITMLQQVRNDDTSKSSDYEYDTFKGDDEESEIEM